MNARMVDLGTANDPVRDGAMTLANALCEDRPSLLVQ